MKPAFNLCIYFYTINIVFLSVCQSRVPGTIIPLCAAQCERMFNTTRTPGDQTGNMHRLSAAQNDFFLDRILLQVFVCSDKILRMSSHMKKTSCICKVDRCNDSFSFRLIN